MINFPEKKGKKVGKNVAIIGAGGIAFDTAEFLLHEKETAQSRERRLISGVIVNRLNKKMKLQMEEISSPKWERPIMS